MPSAVYPHFAVANCMMIVDRDLLSAYVPIREENTGKVRVVFEAYADVTRFVQDIDRTRRWVTLTVVVALGLLHGMLFLIVHYADGLLRTQYDELERSSEALRAARDELDLRVRKQTAQLEEGNGILGTADVLGTSARDLPQRVIADPLRLRRCC